MFGGLLDDGLHLFLLRTGPLFEQREGELVFQDADELIFVGFLLIFVVRILVFGDNLIRIEFGEGDHIF